MENYILNSIVNYANFKYGNKKIISQDNVLHSIILKALDKIKILIKNLLLRIV